MPEICPKTDCWGKDVAGGAHQHALRQGANGTMVDWVSDPDGKCWYHQMTIAEALLEMEPATK